MRKLSIIIFIILTSVFLVHADALSTIFNPFTGKLDYVRLYNTSDFAPAGGSGTGNVSGTGASSNLTKWASATTLTDTIITEVGGKIGIGVGKPGAVLDVNGAVNATTLQTSGTTRISSTGVGTFAIGSTVNSKAICLSDGTDCAAVSNSSGGTSNAGWLNSSNRVILSNNATNVSIGNISGLAAVLYVDNTNARVGVGTAVPGSTLDVAGTLNATTIQTSGTTRISSTGVGTFASTTTVNSKAVCLSDGTDCPAVQNGTFTGASATNGTTHTFTFTRSGGLANVVISIDDTSAGGSGITDIQTNDTTLILANASSLRVNTTLLNNTYVVQANLTAILATFYSWRLGSQVIANNSQVTAGYGMTYEGSMIGVNNATLDTRTKNVGNNFSGWTNTSLLISLTIPVVNVSVGARNVVWIDTNINRTGFNTNVPGNTVEVNGTLNASLLQQGVSSVCLGDGTNCPGVKNGTVTSIASNNYITGGTITTSGTLSFDSAGWNNANGNWTFDKASYSTTVAGDQRWLGVSSSGFLNISGSGKVGLANNNTNFTIGTVALYVNTNMNFTGINTSTPGSALDVRGTLNATQILQGGKSVCLGDGTNCPSTSNDTSTSRGGNVSGGFVPNYLVKGSNTTDLTSSIVQDNGTMVFVNGNFTVNGGGVGNTSVFMYNIGNALLFNLSNLTSGGSVSIDEAKPTQKLHVAGSINTTGNISMTGNVSGLVMSNLTLGCAGISTLVGGSSGGITTPCMRGAQSHVFFSDEATSVTNVGSITVTQRNSNGTFVLTSSNVLDTSPVAWFIVQMSP